MSENETIKDTAVICTLSDQGMLLYHMSDGLPHDRKEFDLLFDERYGKAKRELTGGQWKKNVALYGACRHGLATTESIVGSEVYRITDKGRERLNEELAGKEQ